MPARRLLPKILVIRYDLDLPETSYYLHRDNEINLDEAIATISSLAKHPGRGKLEFKIDATTGQTVSVAKPCNAAFQNVFREALRYLLDYFSTFFQHDTRKSRNDWLGLIKTFQKAISTLPHAYSSPSYTPCDHSLSFNATYQQAMGLLNRVMHCRNPTFAADLVHHWRETLVPHGGSWFEGDFKAGLNAWQQFLLNGSPGFGVPNRAREYVDAQDRDLIPPEDSNSGQTGDQDANMEAHDEIPRAKIITMRHIPLGALAIVQNHKQRAARMLGEYLDDNEDVDGGEDFFVRDFNTNTQCLLQQDTHLRLPLAANSQEQEPTLVHTHPFYPSPLHALTPRHSTGYFDTFCELDTAALTLWMLDEAVASFRGMPGVRHPANNPDNWTMPNFWQGSAAEGAKGAFHMMSVMEVRGISEDVVRNIREGGRTVLGGGGEESRMLDVERLEGLGEVMGEMFDDWEV